MQPGGRRAPDPSPESRLEPDEARPVTGGGERARRPPSPGSSPAPAATAPRAPAPGRRAGRTPTCRGPPAPERPRATCPTPGGSRRCCSRAARRLRGRRSPRSRSLPGRNARQQGRAGCVEGNAGARHRVGRGPSRLGDPGGAADLDPVRPEDEQRRDLDAEGRRRQRGEVGADEDTQPGVQRRPVDRGRAIPGVSSTSRGGGGACKEPRASATANTTAAASATSAQVAPRMRRSRGAASPGRSRLIRTPPRPLGRCHPRSRRGRAGCPPNAGAARRAAPRRHAPAPRPGTRCCFPGFFVTQPAHRFVLTAAESFSSSAVGGLIWERCGRAGRWIKTGSRHPGRGGRPGRRGGSAGAGGAAHRSER